MPRIAETLVDPCVSAVFKDKVHAHLMSEAESPYAEKLVESHMLITREKRTRVKFLSLQNLRA